MTDTHGYAPTEKMLDPTALAEMPRISERHLTDLRREDPTLPALKMLGTLPRWSPAVIRNWMEEPTLGSSTGDRSSLASAAGATTSVTGTKKFKTVQRVH